MLIHVLNLNIHMPFIQAKNIATLCKSVPQTAEQHCQHLVGEAEQVARTFSVTLTLFAQCHNIFNSGGAVTDREITTLGKYYQYIADACH